MTLELPPMLETNKNDPGEAVLEISKIEKMMEEMAHQPREELGKRTPGEIGSYERISRKELK